MLREALVKLCNIHLHTGPCPSLGRVLPVPSQHLSGHLDWIGGVVYTQTIIICNHNSFALFKGGQETFCNDHSQK